MAEGKPTDDAAQGNTDNKKLLKMGEESYMMEDQERAYFSRWVCFLVPIIDNRHC